MSVASSLLSGRDQPHGKASTTEFAWDAPCDSVVMIEKTEVRSVMSAYTVQYATDH